MAAGLRRCIALGPQGTIYPGSDQDYRYNRSRILETGAKWVKIWADWPALQPEAAYSPDKGSGSWRVLELDKQIQQATADGLSVILSVWRFPRWANGTEALTPEQDEAYQLHDRMSKGADPAGRKPLTYKLPTSFSRTSPWGRFIDFLAKRYSRSSRSRKAIVSYLEICNEPNVQFWPQQGPSGTSDTYAPGPITVHQPVAQMFATAKSITASYGSEPVLLGPGTGDRVTNTRTGTSFDGFGNLLLDRLKTTGFVAGRKFAWSHHNFTDIEYDIGTGSSTGRLVTRAATARRLLIGRWSGWPNADSSSPVMLIDEGAARLNKIDGVYGNSDPTFVREQQAFLLQRNWDRMLTEADGAGVSMVTQYLMTTQTYFDCGLCETDGVKRPAFAVWSSLPANA